MADYKLTLEICYRFGKPQRKTGKLTAAADLDAAMKALLLQANMGKKLDKEDHEMLDSRIQRELNKNKLYKKQPLKAMQQLADYNSGVVNIRLVGPSGAVLLDTFPGENEEGVDFDESGKPASARARVQEEYELTEGASIPQAVKLAFPELEPRAAKIIAGWYEAEGAAEDFESTADLASHMESDITDMVWAATDPEEIAIVKAGLITGGFVDADSLPEEDFDESKKPASVKNILREAAKPVQQDKLGARYKTSDLDDRLAGLVQMAQNYKADGYSDVQAMEATLGAYERSEGRNIGYATLERLFQALEARGFSFPEEEDFEESKKASIGKPLRESNGGRYTLEYVLYSRGDVYRKVGSFPAPSDQEACKKAAMIQANYGPLKDLDAEARAKLEEDVMRGFEEYTEQHSDPIEAWDSYITYNSEEFSVKLTAPDGRVLVDTGMDDFAEEEDFEESMKASVDKLLREAAKPVQQDKLGRWYRQSFKERNNVAPFESVIYEILEDQTGIESGEQLFAAAQAEAARDPKFNVEWQAFLKRTPQNKDGVLAKLANTLGFYQVRESAKADKPKMKEALGDKDWSEFQQYMFNAISKVYRRFNIGKGPGEATADKMDMIKVLDWMDAHGFWDDPENY